MLVVVVMQCCTDLFKIVLARQCASRLSGLLDCRKQ